MYSVGIKVIAGFLLLVASAKSSVDIHNNNSSSISEEQERQIDYLVNAFNSVLKQYSSNSGDGAETLRSSLVSLFDDPTAALHYNDISQFFSDDVLTSENQLWMSYVQDIDEKFHFGLNVDIIAKKPYCIDGNLAVVSIEKKMEYNGKSRNVKEVILITLPQNEKNGEGYRISEILSAQNYKGENDNLCSAKIEIDNETVELYTKRNQADNLFFETKDYLNAKLLYEFILNKSTNDVYIKKQIDLCTTYINQADYENKADKYFRTGEFEKAQFWYEKLIAEYKEKIDITLPVERIRKCKEEIINTAYSQFIRKADEALASNNYSSARYYYEQALRTKISDNYAKSKLEESKEKDDSYARQEISRAVRLLEVSPSNYGEYFRILMKYEGYGKNKRLTTKQYYNMVMLLDNQNKDVKRVMKFDQRDCKDFCRIYCKKLNDALYRETNWQWREESERLLLNINKRNQK